MLIWHLCQSLYFWGRHSGRRDVARRTRCENVIFLILHTQVRSRLIVRDIFNTIFNSRIKDTRFEFYSVLSFSFLFASSYLKIPILFSCLLVLFYSISLCFMIYGDVPSRSALPSKSVAFLGVTRVDPIDSLPRSSCKLSMFDVLF